MGSRRCGVDRRRCRARKAPPTLKLCDRMGRGATHPAKESRAFAGAASVLSPGPELVFWDLARFSGVSRTIGTSPFRTARRRPRAPHFTQPLSDVVPAHGPRVLPRRPPHRSDSRAPGRESASPPTAITPPSPRRSAAPARPPWRPACAAAGNGEDAGITLADGAHAGPVHRRCRDQGPALHAEGGSDGAGLDALQRAVRATGHQRNCSARATMMPLGPRR